MTAETTRAAEPKRRRFQFTLRGMLLLTLAAAIVLSWLTVTGFWGYFERTSLDARKAAKRAIAQYDIDGDKLIGPSELKKAPALRAAIGNLDTNRDRYVSADEIAARIQSWLNDRIGLMSLMCSVTLDGRPVSGATVTFLPEKFLVPEKFLGKEIQPASGVTDEEGFADISVEIDPDDPSALRGVQCGLFRVEITKKGTAIPAIYNTQTILGQEIANDAAGILEGIVFELESSPGSASPDDAGGAP